MKGLIMKKFFVVLSIIFVLFAVLTISDCNDPSLKIDETYGTVWYGTTYGNIRVKKESNNKYDVFVCWLDEKGNVEEFLKLGPYTKEEVSSGVNQGICFLRNDL